MQQIETKEKPTLDDNPAIAGYRFKKGLTLRQLQAIGLPFETFMPQNIRENYPPLMNVDVLINLCNEMIEKGEPVTLDTDFRKFQLIVAKAIQQGFLG